jgi:hypothetical protein
VGAHPGDGIVIADVQLDETKARITGKVREVSGVARNEIVKADDAMAFGEETVYKMRSNEASGA